MVKAATAHYTVTLELCSGFCMSSHGCQSDQYRQFCLFTKPVRWKCASSLMIRLLRTSLFLFIKFNICSLKTSLLAASPPSSFWTTLILYGWKCKSQCKIGVTLFSDSTSFLEWRTTNRWGLWSNDALTASMFCGVRTVLTLPLFFLTVEPVSSKLFTHVFMAWAGALYCFDESRISCEIHVGRQRSYRCSYKMILQRKHAVHQSTTPFQTERYSRPRHLTATFPFAAQANNRETPLPNRPIRWRTLYLCI